MWETISDVLTNENATIILVFIVVMAILFAIFVKIGIISIHKKGIKIGKNTALSERIILRKQLEYIQKYCLGLESQLAKLFEKQKFSSDGARAYYFKYLASLVSNEVEKWIMVNSLSQSQSYTASKQLELRAFLVAQAGDCEYNEANLTRKVNLWVTEIIQHLILIRRTDNSNG